MLLYLLTSLYTASTPQMLSLLVNPPHTEVGCRAPTRLRTPNPRDCEQPGVSGFELWPEVTWPSGHPEDLSRLPSGHGAETLPWPMHPLCYPQQIIQDTASEKGLGPAWQGTARACSSACNPFVRQTLNVNCVRLWSRRHTKVTNGCKDPGARGPPGGEGVPGELSGHGGVQGKPVPRETCLNKDPWS